ncbi:transcriptional regulator, ArsR family [Pedobacter hartonius]|uniref:Transcriptional regulator, ArsR family n=1 Tax=Pedobacter hartonius TaxID=425514 RepID=A0A1H4B411_9SPHI|nr:metalloregulator ArsR/SmtB family transcription factor [Pedobacter hartonius]SEA42827.1 transcriptional regulator, ArsR family [Pedobacter hartonius]
MDQVDIFKALSNKTRLLILKWLKDPALHFPEQERDFSEAGVCVGQIQKKARLTQSTVSEYLSLLQRTGLIESTRIGQWTYYKRNEAAFQLLKEQINKEL